jgi:hypothetical protein
MLAQKGWGEVVLENYYSSSANLYVDGRYACSAPGHGGSCTTRVRVGRHKFQARTADGQLYNDGCDMPQGQLYRVILYKN